MSKVPQQKAGEISWLVNYGSKNIALQYSTQYVRIPEQRARIALMFATWVCHAILSYIFMPPICDVQSGVQIPACI